MKAWAIERYGDNSEVKMMSLPTPQPAEDEVLIEIRAASVNPVDFKIREGGVKGILDYKFPLILGNDCSGVVIQVGRRVTQFKVGDEVFTRPHKEKIGTFAEYLCAKESAVALKPQKLSFTEAASIPLVGLTSWQALFERTQMKAGDRVFIPAGSGGVGSFAIQLAKHFGAYVITNTSGKNLDLVKSLGADEVLDYKSQDFSKLIDPVDIVFDTMGGDTQSKAFKVIKPGGRLVSIVGPPTRSFAREFRASLPIQLGAGLLSLPTLLRAKRHRASYDFLFMRPDGGALNKITELIDAGHIKSVIDRVFPFSETKEALAHVEGGHARGKVVVSVESV